VLRFGIAILLSIIPAFSQSPNFPWSFQAWQLNEGLPNNFVVGTARTSDHYLWVATRTGLARFDGVRFAYHPAVPVVSQGVRDELSHFEGVEFLPVNVTGYGVFYAMHVLASCELPAGSVADHGPGTDIALIRAFPKGFEPPAPFFRIRHPGTLTVRGMAVCVPDVYASEAAATAVMRVAGKFLRAVRVPMA